MAVPSGSGSASITSVIPEIWEARFLERLDRTNVWRSLLNTNYQGALARAGDTVKIPSASGTVNITDYERGGTIGTADQLTTSTQDFEISRSRAFHVKVDDVDSRLSLPSLVDELMGRAAQAVSDDTDDYVLSKFTGVSFTGAAAARSTSVGDSTSALAGDTDVNITAAARRLQRELNNLSARMTIANIPTNRRRWVVLHPNLVALVQNYLSVNQTFAPGERAAALAAGFVGTLGDFDVFVANNVPLGTSGNTEHQYTIFAGTRDAGSFISMIARTEAFRHPDTFADHVKGLYVYDADIVDPRFLWRVLFFYNHAA